MNRTALAEALQEAGLTEYQADAYLTLLDQGTAPAVEVARHCSVPAPRIYDVLKALEQRGFVETVDRETLHARPRDPSDVIERLQDKSDLLATAAGEIEGRWERAPLGDNELNMTKRAESAIQHAKEVIRDADRTVDLAVDADELAALAGALEAVDFADVIVRVSLFRDPETDASLSDVDVPPVTTEIRERTIRAPFLAIIDRTEVCFAPTDRLPEPYGLVVNDDIVSFVFEWYFETCQWTIWEPIARRERPTTEYVNLEAFIVDVYPHWEAGESISVTVTGVDTESGECRIVSGTVENIRYTCQGHDREPTLVDLGGEAALTLSTDDGPVAVGSWAARIEDVETRRVRVEDGPIAR